MTDSSSFTSPLSFAASHYGSLWVGYPRPLYGDQLRQLIARLNDNHGTPLPPEVFNYHNGHPRNGPSALRFYRARNGVRLVGIGAEGCALLRTHGHVITQLLALDACRALPERWSFGSMRARMSARLEDYFIHTLLIQRMGKGGIQDAMRRGDQVTLAKRACVVLDVSLGRLGIHLGIDVPPLTIHDLDYERAVPVPVSRCPSGTIRSWAVGLSKVRFRVGMWFEGPWACGMLQGRGYGLLLPAKRPVGDAPG